jgi:hypothetical protein
VRGGVVRVGLIVGIMRVVAIMRMPCPIDTVHASKYETDASKLSGTANNEPTRHQDPHTRKSRILVAWQVNPGSTAARR